MSKVPAWTLRCKVCKTQFGPLTEQAYVQSVLSGESRLDCGHTEAEVVSQSL